MNRPELDLTKAFCDCRGVPVSYANSDALNGLEEAHLHSLSFGGDAIAAIDDVIAAHPQFIMGHLFKAAWLTQAMETRIYDDMVASVEAAKALEAGANEREKGHLAALKTWIFGDFHGAVRHWEKVLTWYPYDLLALQLVHLTNVLLGDVVGLRDVVARVFNLWDENAPGYEFVLGFYAFGLQENRDFQLAEKHGRQSLALRPDNPYAIHAITHIMEMQGRTVDGIQFMEDAAENWIHSNFACHLWWHKALMHLDRSEIDDVLQIYDSQLSAGYDIHDKYEELDAAALLWRLKLLDVNIGDRWKFLADKWQHSARDTLYAFNDVHAMMAFVADGRHRAQRALLGANVDYVESENDANVAMSREVGIPFCKAMQDFQNGQYQSCVERLLPVRYRTHYLGGSFAQRDVISWTLLEAVLRDHQYNLALSLANERCALKSTSLLNWRYVSRAFEGLGEMSRAASAAQKAEAIA